MIENDNERSFPSFLDQSNEEEEKKIMESVYVSPTRHEENFSEDEKDKVVSNSHQSRPIKKKPKTPYRGKQTSPTIGLMKSFKKLSFESPKYEAENGAKSFLTQDFENFRLETSEAFEKEGSNQKQAKSKSERVSHLKSPQK